MSDLKFSLDTEQDMAVLMNHTVNEVAAGRMSAKQTDGINTLIKMRTGIEVLKLKQLAFFYQVYKDLDKATEKMPPFFNQEALKQPRLTGKK